MVQNSINTTFFPEPKVRVAQCGGDEQQGVADPEGHQEALHRRPHRRHLLLGFLLFLDFFILGFFPGSARKAGCSPTLGEKLRKRGRGEDCET